MNIKQILNKMPDGSTFVYPIKDEQARENADNATKLIANAHITIDGDNITTTDYFSILTTALSSSNSNGSPVIIVKMGTQYLYVDGFLGTDPSLIRLFAHAVANETEYLIVTSYTIEIYADKTRNTIVDNGAVRCYSNDKVDNLLSNAKAIIDVQSLPTSNIDTKSIYRTTSGSISIAPSIQLASALLFVVKNTDEINFDELNTTMPNLIYVESTKELLNYTYVYDDADNNIGHWDTGFVDYTLVYRPEDAVDTEAGHTYVIDTRESTYYVYSNYKFEKIKIDNGTSTGVANVYLTLNPYVTDGTIDLFTISSEGIEKLSNGITSGIYAGVMLDFMELDGTFYIGLYKGHYKENGNVYMRFSEAQKDSEIIYELSVTDSTLKRIVKPLIKSQMYKIKITAMADNGDKVELIYSVPKDITDEGLNGLVSGLTMDGLVQGWSTIIQNEATFIALLGNINSLCAVNSASKFLIRTYDSSYNVIGYVPAFCNRDNSPHFAYISSTGIKSYNITDFVAKRDTSTISYSIISLGDMIE